jgi:hypothetical protein
MVPVFGCGWKIIAGTEDDQENIQRICGKCASVMVSAFRMWVGRFLWHGRQFREYLENIKEM